MRLSALEPHFLKNVEASSAYEYTDNIREADGLEMQCPACHWAFKGGSEPVHHIVLWEDRRHWQFVGTGYDDVSILAGSLAVWFTSGCKARFYCKRGKVDFV